MTCPAAGTSSATDDPSARPPSNSGRGRTEGPSTDNRIRRAKHVRRGATNPQRRQGEGTGRVLPAIEAKYGTPIEEWLRLIRASPLTRHMDVVNWLKSEHGLGHGHANALVACAKAERS